ncbi:hypothetical protein BB558_003886 [Smittium angustum]|uniref:Uncharacterized protein n=1 Tax=Smittium angustum TaxID=133377 RepID=A0A2U1J4Q2_SMIAN|nr:hypothetical protein BB558_003886 [Smittium angustum]
MSRGGRSGGGSRIPQNALLREVGNGVFARKEIDQVFPEYNVPVPKKALHEERRIIDLYKQYILDLKKSEFYLESKPPEKDVERYSDKYFLDSDKKRNIAQISTNLQFFPEELHIALGKGNPTKRKKNTSSKEQDLLQTIGENVKDDKLIQVQCEITNFSIQEPTYLSSNRVLPYQRFFNVLKLKGIICIKQDIIPVLKYDNSDFVHTTEIFYCLTMMTLPLQPASDNINIEPKGLSKEKSRVKSLVKSIIQMQDDQHLKLDLNVVQVQAFLIIFTF